jgi:hypothetical protein
MAAHVLSLTEPTDAGAARWRAFSRAARSRAVQHFQRAPAVDLYEALYRRVVS